MSTSAADIWERGKTRIRYVKGLRRSEIVYPIECPNCGKERWLKKWDALKALENNCLCYRCSQSAKGFLRQRFHLPGVILEFGETLSFLVAQEFGAQAAQPAIGLEAVAAFQFNATKFKVDFRVMQRPIEQVVEAAQDT